jgi:hypothetical protein
MQYCNNIALVLVPSSHNVNRLQVRCICQQMWSIVRIEHVDESPMETEIRSIEYFRQYLQNCNNALFDRAQI